MWLTLSLCIGVTLAVPPPCTVSDWESWSKCKTAQHVKGNSWLEDQGENDDGYQNMKIMMGIKQQKSIEAAQCRASGSCPPMNNQKRIDCNGNKAGPWPCRNINMASHVNIAGLGFTENTCEGADIWVWEDDIDYYAIVGLTHGTSFVRITDPENPEVLGILRTQTVSSIWRDMKVIKNYAFIGSEAEDHGIQIFDLTRLRELTEDSAREFSVDAHYTGFGNSHNIASIPSTNLIVAVGTTKEGPGYTTCDGGLHIVDMMDPTSPEFVGCFSLDGYTHDVECVVYKGPDLRYTGHEICFAYNLDTVTIVDITDRQNPVQLSRNAYDGAQYTHQGWLTPDQRYLIHDDEQDEYYSADKTTRTYIWDILNLENPELVKVFYHGYEAIDHNQYIQEYNGRIYVYQSNYEAGLRILIFDDEAVELTEVGYFDCYPSSTSADLHGTWSNYPWLPNGAVAMSSIEEGLFVLLPDYDEMEADFLGHVEYKERERTRKIIRGDDITRCPHLFETEHC